MKLISVSEAAEAKGVSREAVYQAIRRGQLRARRVLGRIGVVRTSLDTYEPRREKVEAGRRRAEVGREMGEEKGSEGMRESENEIRLARAAAGESRGAD